MQVTSPGCIEFGLIMGLDEINHRELYKALDWLQERQPKIEKQLASKHLKDGLLVLYDVSGSYYTGLKSDLVNFGAIAMAEVIAHRSFMA